jgi:copper chaperone CopZ
MKTEIIHIENLKCNGCMSTISNNLNKIEGVVKTNIDFESSKVEIECAESIERSVFLEKLLKLGYPEKDSKNTLLTQAKSYTSCAIGKINNINN